MRMFLSATVALAAACGTTPDERPLTLEVVAVEVLGPSCGQVQCHSKSTKTKNFAFDTIDGTERALLDMDVDNRCNIDGFFGGELFQVLNGTNDYERMPFDAPLAREDYHLLEAWITAGTPNLRTLPCE